MTFKAPAFSCARNSAKSTEPPNMRVQRTRSSPSALRSPLTRRPLGTLKRAWVLLGLLVIGNCASSQSAPNPFNAWGNISAASGPQRSVLVAAATALAAPDSNVAVLSRYAGEQMSERLDLAAFADQLAVVVDEGARLGVILNSQPSRRARAFAKAFPGKTTIIELSLPSLHGDWSTISGWVWDASRWGCGLPRKPVDLTLSLADDKWHVTNSATGSAIVMTETDCE